MAEFDFSREAELWRRLLGADGLCFWRNDTEGVSIPFGCAPSDWIDTGFLIDVEPESGWRIHAGESAAGHLPLMLRARLGYQPSVILTANCAGKGGVLAVWRDHGDVPDGIEARAEITWATCAHLLDLAGQADLALDTHLQMHGLLEALPQGVVIVPNRSRRGFANGPAARWLGLAPGESEVGTLAVKLGDFASRALNGGTVLGELRPYLTGKNPGGRQTSVWRFSDPPHALRVTVAPIGAASPVGWVWLLDDISAEEIARDQLRQREEHFRLFYQSLQQDAVVYADSRGRIIEWNAPFQQLVGYSDSALAGMSMADVVVGEDAKASRVRQELATQGYSNRREKRLKCADGRIVTVESRSIARTDEQGATTAAWEVLHDISERKAAEAELILAAQAFDRSNEGVLLLSPQMTIVTANNAFLAMSGFTRDALLGHPVAILRSSRQDEAFYASLRAQLAQSGQWHGEIWQRRGDGEMFLKWASVSAVRDDADNVTHYLAVFRDPKAEREARARLEYLSTHDELTGLPNRMLFDDRFHLTLGHAARGGRRLAVLMVDLDEFKAVNESLGLVVGNKVLREAARRLSARIRADDTLGRWGGDEFAILAIVNSAEEIAALCTHLLADLTRIYAVEGSQVWVPACIGVSVYPDDGNDPDTLVRKAETALHRAKALNKNTYRFFTEDMAEAARRQLRAESELRHALSGGELFMVYQPQIDAATGGLAGCEALMRWRRDTELISPSVFIPAAEKSGLILELTDWALAETFHQIARWQRSGLSVDTTSINISGRHFRLPDMASKVAELAREAGIEPHRVCLEITEGVLVDTDSSACVLQDLKRAGFHVSIDDFGTGYSSLAYLKRFPVDELKIDKSFVDGIETASSDRAVIDATLTMAHSMGMRVVAEGVENTRQQGYLKARKCDVLQGFLHSRPLSSADFLRFASVGAH